MPVCKPKYNRKKENTRYYCYKEIPVEEFHHAKGKPTNRCKICTAVRREASRTIQKRTRGNSKLLKKFSFEPLPLKLQYFNDAKNANLISLSRYTLWV